MDKIDLLTWTTERPKKKGWYWLKHATSYSAHDVIEILDVGTDGATYQRIGMTNDSLLTADSFICAQFAGPLTPPEA